MRLVDYTDERLGDLQAAIMQWRKEDTKQTTLCHAGDVPHRIYNGLRGRLPVAEAIKIHEVDGEIRAFILGQPFANGFDVFANPNTEKAELKELIVFAYEMTRWQMNEIGKQENKVNSDVFDSDALRLEIMAELGFESMGNWLHLTRRDLNEPIPAPQLREGFVIRPATLDDYEQLAAVHSSAFGSNWNPIVYRDEVMKKPGYLPEREMVVLAPDGRFAAFTVTWRDELNKVGLFEPVGAHSDFQRMGLTRAMMLHTLALMKAEGMEEAEVGHELDNPASTNLYASVGFKELARVCGHAKA